MTMCTALYAGHKAYKDKVKRIVDDLGKHTDDFDGIIASGLSGLMLAAPVSLQLGKTLGVVRHTDEKRHPGDHAGLYLIEKACFLDDFVTRGRTFRQCHDALKAAHDPNGVSPTDFKYYMDTYGEAWIKANRPQWLKASELERNIVAIYTYDMAYGPQGEHYVHVTSAAAVEVNKYRNLWTPELFEALRTGKKPEKQPTKQVVRDEMGRFASPAPAAPKRPVKSAFPAPRARMQVQYTRLLGD